MKGFIILVTVIFCFSKSYSQEEKKIIIPVYGEGLTKDLAIQNALNNAIEETFYQFIVSQHDLLVNNTSFKYLNQPFKNEMISISNGIIEDIEILSEFKIPESELSFDTGDDIELDDFEEDELSFDTDDDFELEEEFSIKAYKNQETLFPNDSKYAVVVQVTISISRLISFYRVKGIEINYRGNSFVFEYDLQKLKEKIELKSIKKLSKILKNIAGVSFDFSIHSKEPKLINPKYDLFIVPLEVKINSNKNILLFRDYLFETLKAVSMPDDDVKYYDEHNKRVFTISFSKDKENVLTKNFRSEESFYNIVSLIYYFNKPLLSFYIENELENWRFLSEGGKGIRVNDDNFKIFSFCYFNDLLSRCFGGFMGERNCEILTYDEMIASIFAHFQTPPKCFSLNISFVGIEEGKEVVNFSFNDRRSLDELREISEYKILPIKR